MRFTNCLDELEHWLQLLQLELLRGTERRHVVALSRLCEVFAHKVSVNRTHPDLERRMKLSLRWLDMKRQVDGNAEAAQPNPVARRVGKMRIIEGAKREPKGIVKAAPRLRLVER